MAGRVFSDEELEALRSCPSIGKDELIRYFTLTPADEAFLRKFLRPQTVLGAAVQLCTLPWLGFVPDEVPSAPPTAVGGWPGSWACLRECSTVTGCPGSRRVRIVCDRW
ncbi:MULTISPECIES: DUF4158 domain-containing protein [Streptomyces]|uniref:DUF4158 domain-containing protein n=1 Tax=Streptomyces ehimensis TaxID=68195 RepID=A0ABV9BR81_9ACTN